VTMQRRFLVLVPAVLLCASVVPAAQDDLKSGPQAGENLPGPIHSVVAFSENASLVGKRSDFVEHYGAVPVLLIFARETSSPLTGLVKKLDAEVAKRKSAKLRAIVFILSDDGALEMNLKDYGEKQAIKHVNVAIAEPEGPKGYKVSKEADVTVVMYKKRKVEANHAFRKGELNEKRIERILADVSKILYKR